MPVDLHLLAVADAADLIAERNLSPLELTDAYLAPGRLHTIRCETAVENYAALEAEFAAIIDALKMKP